LRLFLFLQSFLTQSNLTIFPKKTQEKSVKSVILYMHYYSCPYCLPCPQAFLEEAWLAGRECKYDNEKHCADKHQCKKVMQCQKCEESFTITKKLMKDQKRKIKDG